VCLPERTTDHGEVLVRRQRWGLAPHGGKVINNECVRLDETGKSRV
jgi:hypothetical protein